VQADVPDQAAGNEAGRRQSRADRDRPPRTMSQRPPHRSGSPQDRPDRMPPGDRGPGPQDGPLALPPASAGRSTRGRWRTLANVGPVVKEAMAVNAVLRFFSGYILFLLAFLLRSVNFGSPHHPVSHNLALGALAAGLSAGSLAAMLIGSFFRGRSPHRIMFSVLAIAPAVAIVCAWDFSLWTAAAIMFTAIFCASLAKLGQDSIVQREIGDEIRSSTFAVSETFNQLANVAGGLAGVLVSMLNNGQAALAIIAAGLALALFVLIARRRQRVRFATSTMPPQPAGTR
jgi:predicted MFS family arabinose efflux permease